MRNIFLLICATWALCSCQTEIQPKPKAMLRLDYPQAQYDTLHYGNCPFWFEKNTLSSLEKEKNCSMNLYYPAMKATIYLTYKPVQNNLKNLLRDAQKLTYEHVVKATNIVEQPYLDPQQRVYGMFYQVEGNAASQSQFYVTDSTRHFLTGSIYFNVKPNFDSILPAAQYIREDIRHIMETLRWAEK